MFSELLWMSTWNHQQVHFFGLQSNQHLVKRGICRADGQISSNLSLTTAILTRWLDPAGGAESSEKESSYPCFQFKWFQHLNSFRPRIDCSSPRRSLVTICHQPKLSTYTLLTTPSVLIHCSHEKDSIHLISGWVEWRSSSRQSTNWSQRAVPTRNCTKTTSLKLIKG